MHLSNPSGPFQGLPKEDVFFASSDDFIQLGYGYVVLSMQEKLYPERPLQIYICIEAQPAARSLLLGALLARAEVLRAGFSNIKCRIYTRIEANNWDLLNFYTKSGFVNNNAEEEYIFSLSEEKAPTPPMGCQFASVPLQDTHQCSDFLSRLNAFRLSPIPMDYLTLQMQQPYFMALGFYRGGQPLAEMIMSGSNPNTAGLIMLYVQPEYRRRGLGSSLVRCGASLLKSRGLNQCLAQIYSNNSAQAGLLKSLDASRRRIVAMLPGIDIG
ncbi:MAG: GNAT family N-acetyltransferase [Christensenellales bacterium]|jgi:GNAT superfamily N-acetyltransferase